VVSSRFARRKFASRASTWLNSASRKSARTNDAERRSTLSSSTPIMTQSSNQSVPVRLISLMQAPSSRSPGLGASSSYACWGLSPSSECQTHRSWSAQTGRQHEVFPTPSSVLTSYE